VINTTLPVQSTVKNLQDSFSRYLMVQVKLPRRIVFVYHLKGRFP